MSTDAPVSSSSVSSVYAAHKLYWAAGGICLLLIALFAWELNRTIEPGVEVGTLLFLALAFALLLRNLWMAFCRVEVGAQEVTLHRPLLRPQRVAYRQLADVYEEGRGLKAVLLAYHPRRADGLYELDELMTLALPAVDDHARLFTTLAAKSPSVSH